MINPQIDISNEYAERFLNRVAERSQKSAGVIQASITKLFAASSKRNEFREKHEFVPSNITFSPTYWCNLQCLDCYSNSKDKNSVVLDNETIDKAIQECTEKWAVPFFTITGGESLFYALEIAEKHPEIVFQLYTNGLLIDKGIAHKMAQMGNLFPLISIEGWKEETDRIRGEGVYDTLMDKMTLLTKERVLWGVSFKLTSNNSGVYDNQDFLMMLIGQGAVLGRFLTYMPTGRYADFQKVPSIEQRKKQGEALRNINGKFYTIDYLNNPGLIRGCAAAGLRYVHINPYGIMEPCVFMGIEGNYNLRDAYLGRYDGINCLEHILIQDPLFIATRERAKSKSDDSCCLIIDHPNDLKCLRRFSHNHSAPTEV